MILVGIVDGAGAIAVVRSGRKPRLTQLNSELDGFASNRENIKTCCSCSSIKTTQFFWKGSQF